MSTTSLAARQLWTATRALLVLTLVLGVVFPLAVGLVGLVMPSQANGSLVRDASGEVVGSALIGQSFTSRKGAPILGWFQSRPSAAGSGYDASASSGSNLGPKSPVLAKEIRERRAAIATVDGVPASDVPPDAVTASGSGLDPDISEAYALLQVRTVAAARNLDAARVRALVEAHLAPRDLGYLGEPTVNVLELNLALARMH